MRPARDVPVVYLDHLLQQEDQRAIHGMRVRIHRTMDKRLEPYWLALKHKYIEGYESSLPESDHPFLRGDLGHLVRCEYNDTMVIGTGWCWGGFGSGFVPFLGWRMWNCGRGEKRKKVHTWVSRQIVGGGERERKFDSFSEAFDWVYVGFHNAAAGCS